MNRRPLPVTIIGVLLAAASLVGLVYHLSEYRGLNPFPYELAGVSAVRIVGVVSGVYLLLGRNWARWAALAWIAFHVIVSIFHSRGQVAAHALLCAAFAYFLFRPSAARYFRGEVTLR